MVNEALLKQYLNDIRGNIRSYVKADTKVKIIAYPYTDGSVIVVRFSPGNSVDPEVRSLSHSLHEALNRTGVVSTSNVNATVAKKTLLIGKSSFVMIIPDLLFDSGAAMSDVHMIINAIRKK